jgi:hypothetical protein
MSRMHDRTNVPFRRNSVIRHDVPAASRTRKRRCVEIGSRLIPGDERIDRSGHLCVMAGLGPATHDFCCCHRGKSWVAAFAGHDTGGPRHGSIILAPPQQVWQEVRHVPAHVQPARVPPCAQSGRNRLRSCMMSTNVGAVRRSLRSPKSRKPVRRRAVSTSSSSCIGRRSSPSASAAVSGKRTTVV